MRFKVTICAKLLILTIVTKCLVILHLFKVFFATIIDIVVVLIFHIILQNGFDLVNASFT